MDKEIRGNGDTCYYLSPEEVAYAVTVFDTVMLAVRKAGVNKEGKTEIEFFTSAAPREGLKNALQFEIQMLNQGFEINDKI